ncbi:MAG: hypothetical protein N2Z65_02850 [Clostridiales bacterium]|nr:hypothetical protein [Clostridiales bacterium]
MTTKKLQKNDSDYISNKVLIMFLFALIGIFVLMVVYRLLTHGSTFMTGLYIVKSFLVIGAAGMIYGIIKQTRERKKQQGEHKKLISGANIAVIGLVFIFTALCLLYYDFTVSIKMLYIFLPTIAVLYMIFHTYPREFFTISVVCATGAPFIWMLSRTLSGNTVNRLPIYILICGLMLMGIELLIILLASKNKGSIHLFGNSLSLLSHGANLFPVILSCLIVVLSITMSFLMGAIFAFYCMFAVFIYLFISAVFYTVKLM